MRLVIDASVALKWILRGGAEEQNLAEAEAILRTIDEGRVEVLAPAHWVVEVLAVVARLEPALVDSALLLFEDMAPKVCSDVEIMRLAAKLSKETGVHMFDCLYHAVALHRDATLITADDRYLKPASQFGGIKALRDFKN